MKTLPAAVLIFAAVLVAGVAGAKLNHPERSLGDMVRGDEDDTVVLPDSLDLERYDGTVVDTTADPATACLAVPQRMLNHLAAGLSPPGATLRLGRAFRAGSPRRPFLIAAEIDGPGMEDDGDIAVWSASGLTLTDGTQVRAEDDLAAENSTFADARGDDEEGDADDADVSIALSCVRAEEEGA